MFPFYTSKAIVHKISIDGIQYITCFYTVSVTDAATAAPTSSSQPSTTTQIAEKPSPHVVGMHYVYLLKLSKLKTRNLHFYFTVLAISSVVVSQIRCDTGNICNTGLMCVYV